MTIGAKVTPRIKDKIDQIFMTIQVNIELNHISDDCALTLAKQVRDLISLHAELIMKIVGKEQP